MMLKNLALAVALLPLAFAPATATAQAGSPSSPVSGATTPATSPASEPGAVNPVPRTDCQGGGCDAPPPHITIATPAPAPAPWPLQERISWAANLILVLIAYMGVMLALSALRKIERQTRLSETAAQAAADSAKAALMYAEAQAQAQRPWLVVTAEPEPGPNGRFTIVATNRGRSPTRIVTLVDEIATARDEDHLPANPAFKSEPKPPRVPIILLPGESTELNTFGREDVKSVCATPEDLRRLEAWETRIYLYGEVTYVDLRAPAEKEPYVTGWCCWYIHGHQKSGMIMSGTPEYNRHT
jgi:hypothetical protein